MAIVLGIDPGSIQLGWGVVESRGSQLVHLGHGTLAAPRSWPLPRRLARLYDGLAGVLEEFAPEGVGVEKVYTHRNPATALTLGQARGVVMLAVGQRELELAEYAPSEVKLAVCGHGHGQKSQVAAMVARLLSLRLDPDTSRDSTDALAVAICHTHGRRQQRLVARARAGRR